MSYLRNNNLRVWSVKFVTAAMIIAAVLSSCGTPTVQTGALYPMDSILTAQVKHLAMRKASLHKEASLGNEQSVTDYVPADTSAWKKELEIFHQVHQINKPANRGFYKITEARSDDKLSMLSFVATEDLPVEYLKVYFSVKPENISSLEAKINEENSMYHGSRVLTMEFDNKNGKSTLTRYSVNGGQKMLLGDSVNYSIIGSISGVN